MKDRFHSQFIRLYVEGRDVLAEDVLRNGKWRRTEGWNWLPPPCFSDIKRSLWRQGYKAVLNHSRHNPYRYFRRQYDEEAYIDALALHWEERRVIERDLPVECC